MPLSYTINSFSLSRNTLARWVVLFLFLVSAVLTYLLMNNVEQFYVVDRQVLRDSDFIHSDKFWQHNQKESSIVGFSGDSINIENTRQTSNQVIQRLDINAPVFMRLSVDAGGKGIVAAPKYSAGGIAAIVFYGKDGSRLGHHNVAVLKKSMPLRSFSEVVYMSKAVASVAVAIRLLGTEGVFTVRNPELSVLAEFPTYKTTRMILALLWCILGCWLVFWAMRNFTFKLLVLAGGLSTAIVAGVLMPGGIITAFNKSVFGILPDAIAGGFQQLLTYFFGSIATKAPGSELTKFAHFLLFFFVGVLAGRGFRKVGIVYGLALVGVVAVVTEALQTLVFGRSTSLRDVYIDLVGGIFGLLFAVTCILLVEKFRKHVKLT